MDQRAAPDVNRKQAESRVSGHFGELVQGRLGPDGPVALVTLPCPVLGSTARWTPGPGPLDFVGSDLDHVRRLVRNLMADWGVAPGGTLQVLRDGIPGAGTGSSTTDLLASLRVLAGVAGRALSAEEKAQACLAIEGAVDPLMHAEPVLFASREARVVERLPALPSLLVVGGFAGVGARTDPEDHDFPDMTAAFGLLRTALAKDDPVGLAEAARISAEANQRRNPNPAWGEVTALIPRLGALGPVVSHTGSAIGVLLPGETPPGPAEAALRGLGLSGVLSFRT